MCPHTAIYVSACTERLFDSLPGLWDMTGGVLDEFARGRGGVVGEGGGGGRGGGGRGGGGGGGGVAITQEQENDGGGAGGQGERCGEWGVQAIRALQVRY
jgi:hypothetical protein